VTDHLYSRHRADTWGREINQAKLDRSILELQIYANILDVFIFFFSYTFLTVTESMPHFSTIENTRITVSTD